MEMDSLDAGLCIPEGEASPAPPAGEMTPGGDPLLYPAIFLVGLGGIILEIGLTRIFSIILWHHFAFFSIATALLGLGASGVYLSFNPEIGGRNLYRNLYKFPWLVSLSIIVMFFALTRLGLDVRKLGNPAHLLRFALFYLLLTLPFFFGGCAASLAMSGRPALLQKLYFFDLVGAGAGCLAVVFLISRLGGQGIVILSALIAAAAAHVLLAAAPEAEKKRNRLPLALFTLGILAVMPSAGRIFPVSPPPDKALHYFTQVRGARVLDTIWNSFSRVDTFAPIDPKATWGLSDMFQDRGSEQIGITIDGDGFTSIIRFDGDFEKIAFPFHTLNSMVHLLNRGGTALIIGAGGGIDVLSALRLGADRVDGVEINPAITGLVTGKYRDYSGGLFTGERVRLITGEGRNFIKRSKEQYGLVYLPLVDSWAATYSGAYALSENFLYTVEAFRDYYGHVREGGFISISRWESREGEQPYQTYRICSLAMEAAGVDLDGSVIVTSKGRLANFIWKKGILTPGEIAAVSAFCRQNGFQVLYLPGMEGDFRQILQRQTFQGFVRAYPLDISPVTDDRPFFYLTDRWKYLGAYAENAIRKGSRFPTVFTIVIVIIVLTALFSAVFILVPLRVRSRGDFTPSSSAYYMIYFTILGLAFMLAEVTLMTKFTLFLGHPPYSLSVVLFALLVFSGIGSFLSSRLPGPEEKGILAAIGGLCAVGFLQYLLLDGIFSSFLSLDAPYRAGISAVLIAPLGIFMGMPFPLGLKRLARENPGLIPWAWGVNGCASVMGSVLALVLAQAIGFKATLLLCLFIYGLAVPISGRFGASPPPQDQGNA
jgi:hypothetical protein